MSDIDTQAVAENGNGGRDKLAGGDSH